MSERRGIQLGRFLGAPVLVAPSWFLIALVVVVLFSPQVESSLDLRPPATYLVAALYAVLLLVSVLVHEFAHAAAARALGLPVHEIVANLWGGHTQFEDVAPTPGRGAVVAVVGPLANGALAGLGLLLLPQLPAGSVSRLLVLALILSNALVAVFNLAPGLPLDGGRVVESLVWAVTGRRWTGTLVAGWCGRLVAIAVVLLLVVRPLLAGSRPSLVSVVWAAMIGALLWQGASSAIQVARLRQRAARLRLPDLSEAAYGLPLGSDEWLRWDRAAHVVALDAAGRPVGVLRHEDRLSLLRAPAPVPPGTPLGSVVTVLDPVVVIGHDADGDQVLQALATTPAESYVVVDRSGQVVALAAGRRLAEAVTGERTASRS